MFENLKLNDIGNDVKILQQKLKILGFYNGIITGSFGEATEVGVKEFQNEYGMNVTGVVDGETWDKLNDLTNPLIAPISIFPTLKFGSTGSQVKDLQTKLDALLYFTGVINSNFDLETENAVKRFQLNNGLTADGIVGDLTWNKINSLYGNINECALDNNVDNENNDENNDNEFDSDEIYTVVSGDTLYSIARKFNTTVDTLKILNNLTSNVLSIGQKLKIPTNEVVEDEYIKYTVVSGDTLYSIARAYDTTVDTLKSINNLTSNVLSIGQVLNIPIKEDISYINYVVLSGDTLYGIASKYNISVDAIKELNNLTSNILQIGQVLKLPKNIGNNYIDYTVVRGDSLYSIANRYMTTVDAIKELNNLTSNLLSIGQVLKIPI